MTDLQNAMTSLCFPCNPIPFANGISAGCQENGTDWIKSREAKRILFVLIAQSYSQFARIDLCDEFQILTQEEN